MPIKIKMSCCGRTAQVPDHAQGRKVRGKCPGCGNEYQLTVPFTLPVDHTPEKPANSTLSKFWSLFGSVAKAAVKGGINYLAADVPIGDWIINGYDEWHQKKADSEQKQAEIKEIIAANLDEVRRQARAVAEEVAAINRSKSVIGSQPSWP